MDSDIQTNRLASKSHTFPLHCHCTCESFACKAIFQASARSTTCHYFCGLMSPRTQEGTNRVAQVDEDYDVLRVAVEYMYLGRISLGADARLCINLLTLGDRWTAKGLVDEAVARLIPLAGMSHCSP